MTTTKFGVDFIMSYEAGTATDAEVLTAFADGIKSGILWNLQGSIYGRPAAALIDNGFITRDGELTDRAKRFIESR